MTRSIAACAIALAIACATRDASAEGAPDIAHAKEAYDRGVSAHQRGDFPRAAREFAAADSLAPSSVALRAALDAAVAADDPVIGGELLERSKRVAAPVNPKLAKSIDAARARLAGRAGRIRVTCPAGPTCTATLDGTPFDVKGVAWVGAGPHTVALVLDGQSESKGIDVKPGELVDVVPSPKETLPPVPATSPPGPLPPTAPPSSALPAKPVTHAVMPTSGLPPLVFFIGLGATVVAGAGAGYFMVTTKSKHDDFVAAGCVAGPAAGCDSLGRDGDSSQTTANIAIGVTAALAVATLVVGAAFTNWGSGLERTALRLHVRRSGGADFLLAF